MVASGKNEIITIRGLNKTFGSGDTAVTALSGIDLTIYEGEIFGIIGLSGAGKSTLVRCMNYLEKPTDGSVVRGRLPDFDTPDIKDAGYLLRADMDLIELRIVPELFMNTEGPF